MKNIYALIIDSFAQFLWCCGMSGVYLLMSFFNCSETVIAVVLPLICFYSLYFFYDRSVRWLNRKCKVVFRV